MAKKLEWIYRDILYQLIEKGINSFTQRSLSQKCRVSIGNVNRALSPLEKMNCIEKRPRKFFVINPKKMLVYWASIRNLEEDVLYKTRIEKPVFEIEKSLPPVKFTAYSGYKFEFGAVPSDYSEVVVYGNPETIKGRIKESKGKPNLIFLKTDSHLDKFKKVPLAQIYVDLWNLGTWYAEVFIKSMEGRYGILE